MPRQKPPDTAQEVSVKQIKSSFENGTIADCTLKTADKSARFILLSSDNGILAHLPEGESPEHFLFRKAQQVLEQGPDQPFNLNVDDSVSGGQQIDPLRK